MSVMSVRPTRTGPPRSARRPWRRGGGVAAIVAVAAVGLLPPGAAQAAAPQPSAPQPSVRSIEIVSSGVAASALELTFDRPVPAAEAAAYRRQLAGPGAVLRPGAEGSLVAEVPVRQVATSVGAPARPAGDAVTAAGPSGQRLLCNNFYRWSDTNGVFTLQHQCRGTTAPWGFWLSSYLASHAVGLVTETGMTWKKNGVQQPKMAPHTVVPTYTFHGTFSNSPDGTAISYEDHFRFRHNIGPGGSIDLRIFGSFVLTGTPPGQPCQPGQPC